MFKTWTNQFEKNNYNTIQKKYIVKIFNLRKNFFSSTTIQSIKKTAATLYQEGF